MRKDNSTPLEVFCDYARTTEAVTEGIPIVECTAGECKYEKHAGFGVGRTSGPRGTFCLKEGYVPKELHELEQRG